MRGSRRYEGDETTYDCATEGLCGITIGRNVIFFGVW